MSLADERPMLVTPLATEKRVFGASMSESSTTKAEEPFWLSV
jgi:hypothetical protein